ncbi:hypothetical protein [Zymomonas mobilis]|uniref:hypothetical protein n=1 Tax=Zymomonas mobilis TaxID=542 RepID=UPI00128F10FB|nr:hypothetical protein [Zymomonas mobilis]
MSGCQDVRMSGCQDVRMSGCQDVRMLSGCQDVRMSGCQDNSPKMIWASCFLMIRNLTFKNKNNLLLRGIGLE